jgi:uncharacterized protein (TIGR02099 family)
MALGRFGRLLIRAAAALVGVAVLMMLAATIALDRVPAYQAEIKQWVHAQTGFHIRFAHVAPAWRWTGPELYFDALELRSQDDQRVLVRARGGRIGPDLWGLFRGGNAFAGRVELIAPEIAMTRVGPDRFVLGDVQVDLNAPRAPVDLDAVPTGRLAIRRGRVTVLNWNADLPQLVLDGVDVDLDRQAELASLGLTARLPKALGGTLRLAAMARGADQLDTLTWSADLRASGVSFPGWRLLLRDYLGNLVAGTGAFELSASGRGHSFARADLKFGAAAVVTLLGDGSSAAFDRISGDLALTHAEDRWDLTGRRLQALRQGRVDPLSQFSVSWRGGAAGLLGLHARANYLRAETLFALTGLLPQKDVRDALLAVAPTGQWYDARLNLERGSVAERWRLDVQARFEDAGFAPLGTAPGLRGISGSVAGNESGGHITLEGGNLRVSWPRQWRNAIALDRFTSTIYWRRDDRGLLLATRGIELANRDASLRLRAALALPSEGDSPLLTLAADIDDLNVAAVSQYLPRANLPVKVVDWLERALIAGRVPHADAVLNGPVRHFPFRDGTGVFDVRFDAGSVDLNYANGWPHLANLAAAVQFHNEGLVVKLASAETLGVKLDGGEARFGDFATGDLNLHLKAAGDVAQALAWLRATPLDALSGKAFSKLEGSGALRAGIDLDLPFRAFDHRRVFVHAQLDGATLVVPGLPFPASELSGDFDTDGPQIARADVRGRLLGGPFRLLARSPRNKPVVRTQLDLRGTFNGDTARTALGLPASVAVTGLADWHGVLNLSTDPERDRSLHLTGSLAGLQLQLPEPLSKPAGTALPSWADIDWPATGGTHVNFGVGDVLRGRIVLDPDGGVGNAHLQSAAFMFGGADPVPNDTQIVTIGGHADRLDLDGWIKTFAPVEKGDRPLTAYLHTASLAVGELDYLGLRFRDLTINIFARPDHWRVNVAGPELAGSIALPMGAEPNVPWTVDFDELKVDVAEPSGAGNEGSAPALASGAAGPAAGGTAAAAIDPRAIPSIDFGAKDLVFGERHLGAVEAILRRHDDGVSLDSCAAVGPSFVVIAHGAWRDKDAGTAHVEGTLNSTDVEATITQLGLADVMSGKSGHVQFDLKWAGAPTAAALREATGKMQISLEKGQLFSVKPGAGRVFGLASIAALPRRLALDFSDLTDKGLAFDTVRGSFRLHGGNAYTDDVLLKGPAADIGVIGRIGLKTQDYDQTAVVTGNYTSSLPIAGALAGGPVVGAAVLLFTEVFKQPLRGLARGYYRITGTWDNPSVERINSAGAAAATAEVPK